MTSQDEIPIEPIVTAALSSTTISKEVPYQYQYQQHYQRQIWKEQQSGINRALDETRDNIRKSVDEARKDIPRYIQTANEYQEQAIESAREIVAYNKLSILAEDRL
jgi:hypothetical protein